MLKALKTVEDDANRAELEDVVLDYKLGMMDPGRTCAAYERIDRNKKRNLRKKEIQERIIRNMQA
jgi:hypothetical protein